MLDQKLGAVGNWKWHTLNDPPLLHQVMIDTQLEHKIPDIFKMDSHVNPEKADEAMLAIELDNLMKEKKKKVHVPFKPFQIKMKAMKINENFSLKVVDQKTIYLLFREGTKNVKINIGMELDATVCKSKFLNISTGSTFLKVMMPSFSFRNSAQTVIRSKYSENG